MKRKITQGVAAIAALGALALGGSAIAGAVAPNHTSAPAVSTQSSQGQQQSTAPSKAPENASGPDTDKVQSGDQSTPDKAGNEASGSENSSESTSESGSEQAGSEVAGNDGPGGHADEPGNANADHQNQGQE